MMRMRTVLVVDDNVVDRERIRRLLGSGYIVLEAATAHEGVAQSDASSDVDCVLLDYRLPDRDGMDAIDDFVNRALPVLMLTAQGSEHVAVEAMKRGATDYLSKALLDREGLHRAIESALERQHLREEIVRHERQLEQAVRELERQRAELEASNRALAQREAHLRIVQQQAPALLWTTDRALRYTSLSGAGLRTLDLDPTAQLGHSLLDLLVGAGGLSEALRAHEQALAGITARYTVVWSDLVFECCVEPLRDEDGDVVGTVGVGIDATETRLLEKRLQHVARMEALGKLSGGIAHDFNNVLTAIIGFSAFAQRKLAPDHPAFGDLDQVQRAAGRAIDLVRQLLAFSRQDTAPRGAVDVNAVIHDMLPMLQRLLGEDIHIDLSCAPEPLQSAIEPGPLEQVLVNLVVNARDAMPEGGTLQLSTHAEVVAEPTPDGPPPGGWVALVVRDEGHGMSPQVLDKIFDPFFTTKPVGHGTGLGLSTVYAIMRQAGGTITVESELGRGTTFRIWLPRTTEPCAEPAEREHTEAPRGGETVMVVEDDDQVRAVAVRTLERLGYRVLVAENGEQATHVLDGHEGAVDLVLTDVVMPKMSGPEVAARVLSRHGTAAVVYMSGYSEPSRSARRSIPKHAHVIEKPLTEHALAHIIRDALDRRGMR